MPWRIDEDDIQHIQVDSRSTHLAARKAWTSAQYFFINDGAHARAAKSAMPRQGISSEGETNDISRSADGLVNTAGYVTVNRWLVVLKERALAVYSEAVT